MSEIVVKEVDLPTAYTVHETIVEFKDGNYTFDKFKERIAGKKSLILVAFIDEKPAGYMVGYKRYDADTFYCWMTGTSPMYRKRGVLKALMQYFETWTKNQGYTKLRIKTRNARREMLSFLVKNNFLFRKVIVKTNPMESEIRLEKFL